MESLIEVFNLNKVVDLQNTKLEILKNINFDIKKGEFVSIMGASGSGKSSLISILAGLDRGYTGEVKVCGKDLSKLDDDSLAEYRNKNIGIVFQLFNLIETMSVEENIKLPLLFGDKKDDDKVLELIEKVGLESKSKDIVKYLSGGEKQRVAIARGLICSPDVLFADEPTGALDSLNSNNIMKLFKKINMEYNLTILMVTHDIKMAEYSDKIIKISDGTIVD